MRGEGGFRRSGLGVDRGTTWGTAGATGAGVGTTTGAEGGTSPEGAGCVCVTDGTIGVL